MKTIKKFCALVVCALASLPSLAQQTYLEMEQLTINENVTTVITASEPVRFVDISTDAVVGDQPINNTIRLKPKEGAAVHADGDILAICDDSYRALQNPVRSDIHYTNAGSSYRQTDSCFGEDSIP